MGELEVQIEEKREAVEKIEEELEQAKKLREEERAAHALSNKDDMEASATVEMAIKVLEQFYKNKELVQLRRQPVVTVGEAPPPPPKTWEEPYTGKEKESKGILTIL